jgi:hypothetical protein
MPVTRNFGPLKDLKLTTPAIMREIGVMARERIINRTRGGQGSDGKPFASYSPDYAKRKGAELGDTSPNLTVSGRMLHAIEITKVTEDEVVLEIVRDF